MNRAMGLDASATPAMKAPISADSPRDSDSSAIPRHQAMATRKMYSWILSNRRISRISRYREEYEAEQDHPRADTRLPAAVP